MCAPSLSEKCQNPILTEILVCPSVRVKGSAKAQNLIQMKKETHSFKDDVDSSQWTVTDAIQKLHFEFFQSNPHVVLRRLQSPASTPSIGHPPSFEGDVSAPMMRGICKMETKHPNLFASHDGSVARHMTAWTKATISLRCQPCLNILITGTRHQGIHHLK